MQRCTSSATHHMRGMKLVGFVLASWARVQKLTWTITEGEIQPDGTPIDSILVNNQFPGPPIQATVGDQLVVKVRNRLGRGFTIHWHGIKQTGSVGMDGVPHVTQLPIAPRKSFTYNFTVDVAGTFWYHAHTGLDSEQAFGALIVKDTRKTWTSVVKHDRAYKYDGERTLLLTEWWHKTPEEARKGITGMPFVGVNGAPTHLINGRCLDSEGGPYTLKVTQGKTYRLRLVGATGLSLFRLRIRGHRFTVIEVEGTLVEPVEVDHVDVNSGERYSVLLRADQRIATYKGSITTPFQGTHATNGIFTLRYGGARRRSWKRLRIAAEPRDRFVESQLRPSSWYDKHPTRHYYRAPETVDREIVLSTHLDFVGRLPVHTMNEVKPAPRTGFLWDEIKQKKFKPSNQSYSVNEGEIVQIVIQDLVFTQQSCRVHPWHLHGHSFHVVARGKGFYTPGQPLRPHPRPVLRDTFSLYTSDLQTESRFEGQSSNVELAAGSPGTKGRFRSCGWYALRFKADNPGSWMLHCHITHHVLMGMATVINVHPKDAPFRIKRRPNVKRFPRQTA